MFLYAGYNGLQMYELRNAELVQARSDQQELIDNVYKVATEVENGENPDNSYRLSPMNVSIFTGALAYKATDRLSTLAIGQSDIYTHQVKITSRDDLTTLTFNEMSNPVQLLFGNFDFAFVLIYLVPLIIIAFTYNLQSQELESGRLKLIASNPINPKLWLLQRYIARFLSLCLILGVAVFVTLILLKIPFNIRLAGMVLLAFSYMFFWFAISFVVNVYGKSSGKNAVVLLSVWIVLVLVIPAGINQTANSVYPTPSRVLLLNEVRQTKLDLSKEQDKVLAEYLRNHPELARNEGENQYAYWQGYFATQEMMEESLSPLMQEFDQQLIKQQTWINSLRFLSPAILLQTGFTELAGTSSGQYNQFKTDVREFSLLWRDYFVPLVFENSVLTIKDIKNLPDFKYEVTFERGVITTNIAVLTLFSALLFIVGFRRKNVSFDI